MDRAQVCPLNWKTTTGIFNSTRDFWNSFLGIQIDQAFSRHYHIIHLKGHIKLWFEIDPILQVRSAILWAWLKSACTVLYFIYIENMVIIYIRKDSSWLYITIVIVKLFFIPCVLYFFYARDRRRGDKPVRNVNLGTSRFHTSPFGGDAATTTTPASNMAARAMQTCHVACCANRTPNVVSWGRGGTIAFGSCHSVVLYDPQVIRVIKIK